MKIMIVVLAFLVFAAPAMAATITLEWDASTSPDVKYYRIFRCPIGGPHPWYFRPVGQVGRDSLTFTDRPPTELARYLYLVVVIFENGRESEPSNIIEETVIPPVILRGGVAK